MHQIGHSAFYMLVFLLSFFRISLEALNSHLFHQKLHESTPKWMTEQIELDLKPFQINELSQKSLDDIFTNLKDYMLLIRVRVANNKIAIQTGKGAENDSRGHKLISALYLLQKVTPLPDIDFLITCHDVFGREYVETSVIQGKEIAIISMPIFIVAKPKQYPGMVLLPDWYAVCGFYPDKLEILQCSQQYDWGSKIPLLFFRGADSGIGDRAHRRNFPRPKLVDYSLLTRKTEEICL